MRAANLKFSHASECWNWLLPYSRPRSHPLNPGVNTALWSQLIFLGQTAQKKGTSAFSATSINPSPAALDEEPAVSQIFTLLWQNIQNHKSSYESAYVCGTPLGVTHVLWLHEVSCFLNSSLHVHATHAGGLFSASAAPNACGWKRQHSQSPQQMGHRFKVSRFKYQAFTELFCLFSSPSLFPRVKI